MNYKNDWKLKMLVECTITKYGSEEKYIEIALIKTWDVSEESILYRYEPIFNHFLGWMVENNDDDFIKFIHFTKKHNDDLKLQKTFFTCNQKDGMLVDNTIKIIAGIDVILSFNNVYFFAKGNQFWISNKENQDEQYYYEM